MTLLIARPAAAQDASGPVRFSVEVSGEGPDVLFIPGLSTSREVWRDTVDGLDGHRAHLIQLRGFGEDAGVNARGPIMQPVVNELARYIRDNDLRQPAVIGHSLGGLLAMKLGVSHPDLAGRIMIVDSMPWFAVITVIPGTEPQMTAVTAQAEQMRAMMLGLYGQEIPEAANDALLRSYIVDQTNLPLLREWTADADPRVTGQLFYEVMIADMRQDIAAITVPVTVIYPHRPGAMPQESVAAFYRQQYAALPAAQLVGIGPAAHFVMVDQPEAFRETLQMFLSGQ
ncbi:hypothetical protein AAV99_02550 [Aurantiacibacter marinus]|uniref:AB hydrolase-1 domain-containing protein n=1 Tax=Aurantiacibacter marinus TaxID=874156 RepID=A0A0H0XT49_9SPHN|nr:hypothetical protein AAV99_02550 [Aurantiacibacter marinus]